MVSIPSTDIAFRVALQGALETDRPSSPAALERRIRHLYPDARAVARDLSGELHDVWYVYRDGRYRLWPDADWHEDAGVAWASFDLQGTITAANHALEALVAGGRPIVGRQITEFMLPENEEIQRRQFEAVLRGEVLHSIGRARRLDGTSLTLEYVGRLIDGVIHGWYREAVVIASGPT